jgi:hypothetical protein
VNVRGQSDEAGNLLRTAPHQLWRMMIGIRTYIKMLGIDSESDKENRSDGADDGCEDQHGVTSKPVMHGR